MQLNPDRRESAIKIKIIDNILVFVHRCRLLSLFIIVSVAGSRGDRVSTTDPEEGVSDGPVSQSEINAKHDGVAPWCG